MRILIIRHGDPDYAHDTLTEKGHRETKLLAEKLAKEKIDYLRHLADSVYINDVIERHRVKNRPELEELLSIIASSIGSLCNPTKLSNTFKAVYKKRLTG